MKKLGYLALTLVLFSFARAVPAFAGPAAPLKLNKTIDLSDFRGKSCLVLLTEAGGIKSDLDSDEKSGFKVADWQTVHAAASNFDPSVYKKLNAVFKTPDGFQKLVSSLAGQTVNPLSIRGAIAHQLETQKLLKDPSKIGLYAVELAPYVSLASGAGTLVKIARDNYSYQIGYKPGGEDRDEQEKDVKTGRGFGNGPGHRALDASDVYYLTELGDYLGDTSDPSDFYTTLLELLTQSDPSGYSKLNSQGQTIATDFYTVYIAEADRNAMTGFVTHPWENDLAEVTLLSAYGTKAKKIFKGGKLYGGDPKDYFGVGKTGSGIGETRKDRRALQIAVSNAERKLNPDVVSALENIIGQPRDGDLIHGLMTYLNDPKNQAEVQRNARELVKATVDFLKQIRGDASKITDSVQ